MVLTPKIHFSYMYEDGFYGAACGVSGWTYKEDEWDTKNHKEINCEACLTLLKKIKVYS